ncbi:hypothetical protein [Halalkalicoccus subterraneus]|nr:hypothetical protein [Halalkalicoccus subterraneus]
MARSTCPTRTGTEPSDESGSKVIEPRVENPAVEPEITGVQSV